MPSIQQVKPVNQSYMHVDFLDVIAAHSCRSVEKIAVKQGAVQRSIVVKFVHNHM